MKKLYEDYDILDIMQLTGLSTIALRGSKGDFDCPVCGKKKKFNINAGVGRGGVCRCAACNTGGDKIDLFMLMEYTGYRLVSKTSQRGNVYSAVSDEDRALALREIDERLHIIRRNPGYLSDMAKKRREVQESVKSVVHEQRPPHERDAVYRAFLRLLKLSASHREALIARGLTEEDIDRIQFRSTPLFGREALAAKLVSSGYDLSGIPGFFLDEQKHWSIYCPDAGYFVPICNHDGHILSMQIRLNKPTTDKNKYRFFSSSRDTLSGGTYAASMPHVEMCSEKPKYLYVTEGAIKAHVAHSLYRRLTDKDDIIFVAIPGVDNQAPLQDIMDWLVQFEIEQVVEFFDLDKYTKASVVKALANLEALLKRCMAKWYEQKKELYDSGTIKRPTYTSFPRAKYRGKGVDDHLLVLYKEKI